MPGLRHEKGHKDDCAQAYHGKYRVKDAHAPLLGGCLSVLGLAGGITAEAIDGHQREEALGQRAAPTAVYNIQR